MGRLKTDQEKKVTSEHKKREKLTKKLVLDMNDDLTYYKGVVQEMSQSVIDLVNLAALTKKALLTDEGTDDEKALVEKALNVVIDTYLEGDHTKALTHKGSDVEPETVRKVDRFLEELKAEKEAEEKESGDKKEE